MRELIFADRGDSAKSEKNKTRKNVMLHGIIFVYCPISRLLSIDNIYTHTRLLKE